MQWHFLIVMYSLILISCKISGNEKPIRAEYKTNDKSPNSSAESAKSEDLEENKTEPTEPKESVQALPLELSCIRDKVPSDVSPSSIIACAAIESASKSKADLSKFIEAPGFVLDIDPSVRVLQELIFTDPKWHVVLTLSHSSATTLLRAIDGASLKLIGTSVVDNKDFSISGKMSKIAVASSSLSTSSGKYTSIASLAMEGAVVSGKFQKACVSKSTADAGLHIGRFLADSGNCTFAYGLGTEKGTNFLFIVSDSLASWKVSTNGAIPSGAIPIGYEYSGAPQYLCRAEVPNEGFIFGKFAQGYDGCNIAGISSYYRITSYLIFSM